MYLYETTAIVDGVGTTRPVRFCLGGGYNKSSGPGYYAGNISEENTGAIITRSIYQNRLGFGLGEVDPGVVSIVSSAEWDWLADAGFGKEAIMYIGEKDDEYNDLIVVARGVASNALVGEDTTQLGWQDKTKILDNPLSEGIFAGTNSGTTGLEGLSTDIKGQRKPRAWGQCIDIQPVLLNAPLRIYGWNHNRSGTRIATQTINAVRVRGSAWTFTSDYANSAALAAASISVGFYGTCKAESLIRMGGSSSIDGNVRIDVTIGATAADNIAGNVVKAILLDTGESLANINTVEIAALNAARPYTVQFYTQDDDARSVIDQVLSSVLAWCVPDTLGVYRFGFVPTSLGTAVANVRKFRYDTKAGVNDVNLLEIKPVLDTDTKGIPAKSVRVRYGYRWNVLPIETLASGLTDTQKAQYSTEFLITPVVSSSSAATQFTNATDVTYDTLLINSAHAVEVGDALLTLLARKHKRYNVAIAANPDTIEIFQPGAQLILYHPRFGMENGYQVFITQLTVDARARQVKMQVLGIDYV